MSFPVLGVLALASAPAWAQTVELSRGGDAGLELGSYTAPGGKTLTLRTGVGSGAFRRAEAPAGQLVTISDRGPNIACDDAKGILGVDGKTLCGDAKRGRIYPIPGYSPTIYRLAIEGDGFRVTRAIPLRDAAGTPVTGMPNPLSVAATETPLDGNGKLLQRRAADVDAEALVELGDGTFWVGEENGPSLLHVSADGRIERRLVPAGTEQDFTAAGYAVQGGLPAILVKRQVNRGIEAMAISADERFLVFVMQSPLANPDGDTYQKAANTRVFKLDRASQAVVAEYVYALEPMTAYPGEEKTKQNTARISELTALPGGDFLLDERTDRTTKIFRISLDRASDIHGSAWDDLKTSPSLEQAGLAAAGITPVPKALVLDSATHPELPTKIEGMALEGPDLLLINDDDFGIEGARTVIARVKGLDLD